MKNDILKIGGVGEVLLSRSGEDPIYMGFLKDVAFATSATTNKTHAGTGAFPVATYTSEKEMSISADEAMLSLQSVRITQGDNAVGSTILRTHKEEATIPAATTYEVTVSKAAYEAGKVVVMYANGTRFEKESSSPSGAGKYYEKTPGSGVLEFNAADASEDIVIVYVYEYDSSTNADELDMVSIDGDARACAVEFHYLHSFADCGRTDLFELMFYQTRPTGALDIKFTHADIGNATGTVLDVEDALRADKRLGMMALKSA